jgi:hypothetical protein
MELSQFEKAKIVCKRCEKRISDARNANDAELEQYWVQFYDDFKKAVIVDHGNEFVEWMNARG